MCGRQSQSIVKDEDGKDANNNVAWYQYEDFLVFRSHFTVLEVSKVILDFSWDWKLKPTCDRFCEILFGRSFMIFSHRRSLTIFGDWSAMILSHVSMVQQPGPRNSRIDNRSRNGFYYYNYYTCYDPSSRFHGSTAWSWSPLSNALRLQLLPGFQLWHFRS